MIRSQRLLLRPWQPEDFPLYAALNADPRVRRYFPNVLTRKESDAEIAVFQQRFAKEGFGMLAAELAATQQFAGILGLQTMPYAVPGLPQPAVEIGWRLAQNFWRQGLATEGARAVIDYAFNQLKLPSVVAVTTVTNQPSRRVMERLGMHHRPELNFEHPRVPEGHAFRPHVLYQLNNQDFAYNGGTKFAVAEKQTLRASHLLTSHRETFSADAVLRGPHVRRRAADLAERM